MSHHVNRGHQCAPDSACRPPSSLAGPLLAVLLFHLRHQQRDRTRGWNNPQHLQQQQQHCSPYQSSGQSCIVRCQALGMVSRLGHPFRNAACPWKWWSLFPHGMLPHFQLQKSTSSRCYFIMSSVIYVDIFSSIHFNSVWVSLVERSDGWLLNIIVLCVLLKGSAN